MAAFIIPENPPFNVTAVEQVKQSDFVIDSHLNGYFQIFLDNDYYVKKGIDALSVDVDTRISNAQRNITQIMTSALEEMQQTIEANAVQECTTAEIDAVLTAVFG